MSWYHPHNIEGVDDIYLYMSYNPHNSEGVDDVDHKLQHAQSCIFSYKVMVDPLPVTCFPTDISPAYLLNKVTLGHYYLRKG